ncbi:MAG TPA: ATP-binding protein [Terriglobales bacterium]|nr:ATP-binding protein [Terriglobales bacterium]
MATPEMRVNTVAQLPAQRRMAALRRRSALRLLDVERSEDIFPVLLEEIMALGFRRAAIATVDPETGELVPAESVNAGKQFLAQFRTSLYASENPLVGVLQGMQPAVLPQPGNKNHNLYCHPFIYRNRNMCWEAERERRADCLALVNFSSPQPLQLDRQTCEVCDMRSYAGLVAVELNGATSERELSELRALIELANRYLARLFKVEHYYNRMRDMDTTIAQMQTMMQSMSDPVILTDTHHRVITQNRAAEQFFKLPEETTEGLVRAVELNNLLFSAALSSMAMGGEDASRDLTLVDPIEGEEVLFEAVTAPTFTREGMRTGLVTVMRNVTDLRRADEELRTNFERLLAAEEVVRQDRDRLNLIIENVGDPIIVADSAGKVVLLDPLAQELFARSKEGRVDPQVVKNLAKLDAYIMGFTFSFSDRENAPLKLWSPGARAELEYDARSGKIYDVRGQVAYTVTVLRDLTPLRKVEQLKVERRMLEVEKFAATGRLAGTIAHEVNNPMEAIKNAIYLLADGVKEEKKPVYDILKGETERVARIVRQMLGLYRTSEQAGSIDINSVIEDTLLLFTRQLQRNGIVALTDLDKLPPAVGSADQFRQVLSNLVVNAKDSMAEGGRLIIRTRHVPEPDGIHSWVRISIADTGAGIAHDILPNIFEAFVSTKGEKGTGLGLWIVKGIIENHGGKIKVRSKVGKGTLFQISLPVVR